MNMGLVISFQIPRLADRQGGRNQVPPGSFLCPVPSQFIGLGRAVLLFLILWFNLSVSPPLMAASLALEDGHFLLRGFWK